MASGYSSINWSVDTDPSTSRDCLQRGVSHRCQFTLPCLFCFAFSRPPRVLLHSHATTAVDGSLLYSRPHHFEFARIVTVQQAAEVQGA
jgi:hypothetical protein